MNSELKKELEAITTESIEMSKNAAEPYSDADYEDEDSKKFHHIISDIIIPTIKKASWLIGRSGCSLNFYSNEGNRIADPELRTVIQILFYPRGHSKKTLGVNVPFLQFAYSPSKKNVKITAKLSIKSDSARLKLNEISINEFNEDEFNKYLVSFLKEVMVKKEAEKA